VPDVLRRVRDGTVSVPGCAAESVRRNCKCARCAAESVRRNCKCARMCCGECATEL
jgi:hypothetical protein